MFGGWQIGHTDPVTYARKYDKFVKALKKTNNKLRFIAVGACSDHFGHWNEQVLRNIKEKIDEFLKGPNKTFNIKYLIIERK